jgi:aminoglycoside phosphotransferase (APT) family kinase protein
MTAATGVRIGWHDLPGTVRAAVEAVLGAPVVEALSQPGGFSPGTADRVRTAAGTRAFVKAVSPDQNPLSPAMHRREAEVTAGLPATAPAPRLLGHHDDGHWIVLVLQDVEGRHPVTPWDERELDRVLAALERLAVATTPAPAEIGLRPAEVAEAENLGGWARLRDDPDPGLDVWSAAHLDEWCARAERAVGLLAGNTLVHLDIRADNLLLGPDGTVTVVDWPAAAIGPAWLDRLLLLINVRLHGGLDTTVRLADLAARTGVDRVDLIDVLAGYGGYFADAARRPPPPGLPTLRAFQRAQADAVTAWLRELEG